ncbi:MAG: ABC transporter permease [Candidatus Rokubacteria bacterium]|nr:ABC transporter permease [Candidatus Rokubacteria bacterium]
MPVARRVAWWVLTLPEHTRIAWRNVLRNKRRTAITVSAIASGSVALITFGGYMDYAFWGLRETTIRNHLGHLQIARTGHAEKRLSHPMSVLLEGSQAEAVERILLGWSEVEGVSRRLEISGLIGNGETTLPFVGRGMEPEKEGAALSFLTIASGAPLATSAAREILVAKGLAAALDVKAADRVILLTTTLGGTINGMDVTVAGTFETGAEDFDQRAILLPLPMAQRLVQSDRVDRVVVLLTDTDLTDPVARRLSDEIERGGWPLEVRRWTELASFYHRVVRVYEGMYRFVRVVIALIVVLSILNTMLMAIFERTREIGTLMALGVGRPVVAELFLLEGLLVGLVGAALGTVAGVGTCHLMNALGGIAMAPPPGASRGYVVFLNVVPRVLLLTFASSVLTALVSSLYPALRASRMRVAAALRYT